MRWKQKGERSFGPFGACSSGCKTNSMAKKKRDHFTNAHKMRPVLVVLLFFHIVVVVDCRLWHCHKMLEITKATNSGGQATFGTTTSRRQLPKKVTERTHFSNCSCSSLTAFPFPIFRFSFFQPATPFTIPWAFVRNTHSSYCARNANQNKDFRLAKWGFSNRRYSKKQDVCIRLEINDRERF